MGNKKIVITGATGSIGLALVKECIAYGMEILVFVREKSKRRDCLPDSKQLKVIECNLSDLVCFDGQEKEYDVFYHLGWDATIGESRNDMKLQLQNIQYTLDAVELAAKLGCHTFIGAGSQAEYGRSREKLNANTPVFPENGYGMAKLCAGQMSRIECRKLGIRHIWTRILSVYGPNDSDQTMIMTTIKKLLCGEKPLLTKGEQEWDYLYCTDAAKALLLLGEKGKENKIYTIGSGRTKRLAEYMTVIKDQIDPKAELGIGEIPYVQNQVMYLCADISDLIKDTGFSPEVNFEDGIRNTIQWVRTRI